MSFRLPIVRLHSCYCCRNRGWPTGPLTPRSGLASVFRAPLTRPTGSRFGIQTSKANMIGQRLIGPPFPEQKLTASQPVALMPLTFMTFHGMIMIRANAKGRRLLDYFFYPPKAVF
ncbi:hypothetical protein J3459_004027 [Metarhizium acridum]|nr:hypothetical protein J3459_004027 [Metarhizium acridum]